MSDLVASSFNWKELTAIAEVCPMAKIALLDGAIRRDRLLEKIGREAEPHFSKIFTYGNEEYMLPRFSTLAENLSFLDQKCCDPRIRSLLAEEVEACLGGATTRTNCSIQPLQ